MSKTLVIQIPCYNEALTLAETISDLPKSLPGFSRIIILVIDDGSIDNTVQVALRSGAEYIVRHLQNRGLACAFMTGLNTALALGADVIVNTDADHQYPGRYIPDLVEPILAGKADLVIGNRQPSANIHFSPIKRLLESLGSLIISHLSQTDVPDASSGFRAYSRYVSLRMHTYNDYSYTLETLIQAGRDRIALVHIPIKTNPSLRSSRLHKGILNFIWRQSGIIVRTYILYQPLKSFSLLGLPFSIVGIFLIARFLFYYFIGVSGTRHIQSVSIGGTLFVFGILLIFLGLLGDAIRANRKMMEEILVRLRDQILAGTPSEINGSLLIRRESEGEDK